MTQSFHHMVRNCGSYAGAHFVLDLVLGLEKGQKILDVPSFENEKYLSTSAS